MTRELPSNVNDHDDPTTDMGHRELSSWVAVNVKWNNVKGVASAKWKAPYNTMQTKLYSYYPAGGVPHTA